MYDSHVHSDHSMDCKWSMYNMVLGGIANNLKSICFTDHIDLESTEKKLDFCFDLKDYFKDVNRVKHRFKKDIEILGGVELGMKPNLENRYNELLSNYSFDFVLMSLHSVKNKDIFMDKLDENLSSLDILNEYFQDLLYCVKNFKNYDVLGHLDFIDRYLHLRNMEIEYTTLYPIIVDILTIVIQDGKGIEVNTSGIRYGLDYFHPKPSILRLYKDLGGEIITIGSDAHSPKDIGYEFKNVERLLKEIGFKYIYIFKDRKKYPIHIG